MKENELWCCSHVERDGVDERCGVRARAACVWAGRTRQYSADASSEWWRGPHRPSPAPAEGPTHHSYAQESTPDSPRRSEKALQFGQPCQNEGHWKDRPLREISPSDKGKGSTIKMIAIRSMWRNIRWRGLRKRPTIELINVEWWRRKNAYKYRKNKFIDAKISVNRNKLI